MRVQDLIESEFVAMVADGKLGNADIEEYCKPKTKTQIASIVEALRLESYADGWEHEKMIFKENEQGGYDVISRMPEPSQRFKRLSDACKLICERFHIIDDFEAMKLDELWERLMSFYDVNDRTLFVAGWERYKDTKGTDEGTKLLNGLYDEVEHHEKDIKAFCRLQLDVYAIPDWIECALHICNEYHEEERKNSMEAHLQSKLLKWGIDSKKRAAPEQQKDNNEPQQEKTLKDLLPDKLKTDEAVKIFQRAIDAKMIEKTATGLIWHYSNALLSYLCGIVYCGDTKQWDMYNKEYRVKRSSDYLPETELNRLFGVTNLGQSRHQLTTLPKGHEKVDDLFK